MATYLKNCRFGIGPVSQNVVEACIEYANQYNPLILVASRNQVEYNGGYIGWSTPIFSRKAMERTPKIFLERDHGGPGQVDPPDNWTLSFQSDCNYFDVIHVDPWKIANNFEDGCKRTAELISFCYSINPSVLYEVGTEEAIFKYEADQLDKLLTYLKQKLIKAEFERIFYAVIQNGTALYGNKNIGSPDRNRLFEMIKVCRKHKIFAKTHNCDYLPVDLLRQMLADGVDAINIAPEFGRVETQTYLENMSRLTFDLYYSLCLQSKKWQRWLGLVPPKDKKELILSCGHYVIQNVIFQQQVKPKLKKDIDNEVKRNIIKKLKELHGD